jgi:hypothetical protein
MDCVLSTSLRSTVTVAGAVYCKLADRELDAPALAFGMPVVAWAVLPVVGVAVVVVAAVVAVAAVAAVVAAVAAVAAAAAAAFFFFSRPSATKAAIT